jgi:lipopolysaccharide/colanic/teichoic acid biosynthesis glycosyltransferase
VSYERVKRVFDVAAAVALSLILVTLLLGIAALALTFIGRPIFFSQERVGKDGAPFLIYKFRTMRTCPVDAGCATTEVDDIRVTPFGRMLRRTHLDELPQILNILRGEMTLVGPRPEQTHLVEVYRKAIPNYDYRQRVLPGVTGLSQVKFGYANNIEDSRIKLHYDLIYLNNFGWRMDLAVLAKTLSMVYKDSIGSGRDHKKFGSLVGSKPSPHPRLTLRRAGGSQPMQLG